MTEWLLAMALLLLLNVIAGLVRIARGRRRLIASSWPSFLVPPGGDPAAAQSGVRALGVA